MLIPEEKIVVLPDLFDAKEEVLLAPEGFGAFFRTHGFGWSNPEALLRVVDRDPAESYPNIFGERIRQLIAQVLVFTLPLDTCELILNEYGVNDSRDWMVYNEIMRTATLLATKKLKASGESRLHGKLAAAAGGHVDEDDLKHPFLHTAQNPDFFDDLIRVAAMREVNEELRAKQEHTLRLNPQRLSSLGVMNSGHSAVERVHIGMVSVLAVPEELDVTVRESDKLELVPLRFEQFKDWKSLSETYELDTWTRLILQLPGSLLARQIALSLSTMKE